jgi:acyl-CoA synthetase (AMP-forming)/AMP-acid ligase II
MVVTMVTGRSAGIPHRLRLPDRPACWWNRLAPALSSVVTLIQQGVLRPMRPDKLLRIFLAWRRWGFTLPLGYAVGAVRHPDRPAVIDERGTLSFAEIDHRTTRLARGLRERGVRASTRVGVLCRNHHGVLETVIACGKLGADVVLLNTGLAVQQLNAVLDEQQVGLLFVDAEFADLLAELPSDIDPVLAWGDNTTRHATLESLIASSSSRELPRPPSKARIIVLTSGTTGTPRGARRPDPPGLSTAATVLSGLPLRDGERILVCAPMFHTWGLAAFQLGAAVGATLVLRRRFDPQETLALVHDYSCTAMFVVPVMLQRILDSEVHNGYDYRALRIVACSGSALPADLATRFQRAFGPILYNVYGSTEVSWATIAQPDDLLHAPGTAGRPPRGTDLRILDENGSPVATGEVGRIFVGNEMLFEGYTNGRAREAHDGLMSTGDLGRLDRAGRLFVVGREDDMIVSGGENVYPKESEDVIAAFPEVSEAAVIGVADAEFGQRLAAFVVPREGHRLDESTVRDRLKQRLPRFAVPRDIVFLDTLPRNATGKVVPRELDKHLGGSA